MRRVAPGLILWLTGLLLGSLSHEPVPAPPTTIRALMTNRTVTGGEHRLTPIAYQVLAADFHVHGFPGDGSLLPWDLAREARRRGLHAIALAGHNHMLPSRIAELASAWMPEDVLILPGEEVTSPAFHLSAVGIGETVPWAWSAAEVIAAVHAQGGLAIASHPDQRFEGYTSAALATLDGVESAHPMAAASPRNRVAFDAFYARAARERPGVAAIGSSDFHREAPVGLCRTYVFVTERSAAAVLSAVRDGRTAACDPRGITTGGKPWADLARASCRDAARAAALSSARSSSPADRFAVACALIGMAAVMGTLTVSHESERG